MPIAVVKIRSDSCKMFAAGQRSAAEQELRLAGQQIATYALAAFPTAPVRGGSR